jgi:hypothetical protein
MAKSKKTVPKPYKLIFGGWYQRTTLHLTEIYDFLDSGFTRLDLDDDIIQGYRKEINIQSVEKRIGYLEYVELKTTDNITVRYYEDGLYVIEKDSSDFEQDRTILHDFYTDKLKPGLDYIFSLGAPTPKILANIKTEHPFVGLYKATNSLDIDIDHDLYGKTYSSVEGEGIKVYKNPGFFFISHTKAHQEEVQDLVDMQIFFREFKDQLVKYLNIHRSIWEQIRELREDTNISVSNLKEVKAKFESYELTINLITNRINQMDNHTRTRSSIAVSLGLDQELRELYRYRFEVLLDTLNYIKEIWAMTKDYLHSAIRSADDVLTKATSADIKSLGFISSIFVINAAFGWFTTDSEWWNFSWFGVGYVAALIITIYVINFVIRRNALRKGYKIQSIQRSTDL